MRAVGRLTHEGYPGRERRGVMFLTSGAGLAQTPAKGLPHGAGIERGLDRKVTVGRVAPI